MKAIIIVALTIEIAFLSYAIPQDCVCGIENSDTTIIGGTTVTDAKYPWMAYLSILSWTGLSRCGGAIVNDRYILTAAHCFNDALMVLIGVGTNEATTQEPMQRLLPHPGYVKMPPTNDIALVKLKTPLTWSRKVRPICLPTKDMDQSGKLTLAGWGVKDIVTQGTSNVLLETTVTEYKFDECLKEWTFLNRSSQFCAALVGQSSCHGDSGGSIWKRLNGISYTVGLVSFANSVCASTRGTVFTKVSHYLDWIKNNTADGIYCRY